MITIQELHKYYKLADQGLVKKFNCPSDHDHPDLIPSVDENDNPILYCLGCSSRITLGENLSSIIKYLLY